MLLRLLALPFLLIPIQASGIDLFPQDCGFVETSDRISNGEATRPFEFPFMALLIFRGKNGTFYPGCGGSIINSRYILTAAHCVENTLPVQIRLGEQNFLTNPDCEYEDLADVDPKKTFELNPECDVAKTKNATCAGCVEAFAEFEVVVHPKRRFRTNDIALIRVERPIKFTDSIKPICLPLTEETKGKDLGETLLEIAGWGVNHTTEKNILTESTALLKAEVAFVSPEQCKEKYEEEIFLEELNLTDSHLCAYNNKKKKSDACNGDSGGPLMTLYNNKKTKEQKMVQYGIVAFGKVCGDTRDKPGVFTNVIHHLNWILGTVKP